MNRIESLLFGTGAALLLAACVMLLAGCAPTIAPVPHIDPALLACHAPEPIASYPWPTNEQAGAKTLDYRACCAAACDQLAKIGAATSR